MNAAKKVKEYLLELGCEIIHENPQEELFIVNQHELGIEHVVIDCEEPILIIEAILFPLELNNADTYRKLLQKNRDIVHGAFSLDDENRLIFRDTLQLENLDINEVEGSLSSLALLLGEYSEELLIMGRK